MTNPSELDPGDVEDAFWVPGLEAEASLDEALAMVRRSPNHRVLTRMSVPEVYGQIQAPIRRGVVLDLETTGTDTDTARIIELGLVAFEYDDHGRIGSVMDRHSWRNDPGEPLEPEIVEITGLTDADLAGQRIDWAAVLGFLKSADLIVAHGAHFDRPIAERGFADDLPGLLDRIPWACSRADIPWSSFGVRGQKLEYLGHLHGFFFDGHQAADDAAATLHLLAQPCMSRDFLDVARTNFSYLIDSLKRTVYKVYALGAPFPKKDRLKQRGYHWNADAKYWYTYAVDIPAEQKWLKAKIYRGMEFGAKMAPVTRLNMFSVRG